MPYTNPVRYPNALEQADPEGALNQYVIDNIADHEARINQYAGVYTDEAARDAAITSPTEGMRVYLTAPTVPAATGSATVVPTGITTIYNGTSWVCVTEVGAFSTTSATTTSTTYVTTLTSDTTAVSVTLATGTTALVMLSGSYSSNVAVQNYISFSVSGATTLAAQDTNSIINGTTGIILSPGASIIVTGLTAGNNTFTLNYRVSGGTATYIRRTLVVKGIA